MNSIEDYVDEMNQLLRELIQVATRLRDMSLQVISEEDLAPLQKYQEDLLAQLEKVDHQMQQNYRHQLTTNMQEPMHQQLQVFQRLNQEFMENLSAGHGLIQFDLHRFENRGEQDFSGLSRLNKMPSSPDSSEAVEPEKNEKS